MEKNEIDEWVETNIILEETTSDIKIDDEQTISNPNDCSIFS